MDQAQSPSAAWPRTGPGRQEPAIDPSKPLVLRTLGEMTIVTFRNRFFAVPQMLGAIETLDLTRDDDLPPGVIAADNPAALVEELTYIGRWADSRGQFDAQEGQKQGSSPLRADSALGEPEVSVVESGFRIVHGKDGAYAVRGEVLDQIGKSDRPADGRVEDVEVVSAVSDGAMIELMGLVNDYVVFHLDQLFYAVPRMVVEAGTRNPKLAALPLHEQPGAVVAKSYPEVLRVIGWRRERRIHAPATTAQSRGPGSGTSGAPRKVRSLLGFNIIAYEGWFYAIPESLGAVDLTETDALSLPGVIADVAQVALENEIQDRVAARTRQG
jgi:hypothetical protein